MIDAITNATTHHEYQPLRPVSWKRRVNAEKKAGVNMRKKKKEEMKSLSRESVHSDSDDVKKADDIKKKVIATKK
jgi:hypothetical protein